MPALAVLGACVLSIICAAEIETKNSMAAVTATAGTRFSIFIESSGSGVLGWSGAPRCEKYCGSFRYQSLACHGSFHLDVHAHPGMDAALKTMCTFRQTCDLDMAALKDSSLGHPEGRKAASTLGNRGLSPVEPLYKTSAEFRHLGEGVRLAALVDYGDGGSFLDGECVRFEIPLRVRSSSGCLRK